MRGSCPIRLRSAIGPHSKRGHWHGLKRGALSAIRTETGESRDVLSKEGCDYHLLGESGSCGSTRAFKQQAAGTAGGAPTALAAEQYLQELGHGIGRDRCNQQHEEQTRRRHGKPRSSASHRNTTSDPM